MDERWENGGKTQNFGGAQNVQVSSQFETYLTPFHAKKKLENNAKKKHFILREHKG